MSPRIPPYAPRSPVTDVLFNFLIMARRRDRSRLRRLFFRSEQLLEAGVEQLVETACARVEVRSQHEDLTFPSVEAPASRRHSVHFWAEAEPIRPSYPGFEERVQRFPLSESVAVFTCPGCSGSGEVDHGTCGGSGQVRCGTCGGDGRVSRSDGGTRSCGSCGGDGRKRCSGCSGSGRVRHTRCAGEGQLASWTEETYTWTVQERAQDVWPLSEPPRRLRKAFSRWIAREPELLELFDLSHAEAHLGYATDEVAGVTAAAAAQRERLEREARNASIYLFHQTWRRLSPTGYTVVRLGGRASYYFLVGRGPRPEDARPAGRLDPWKLGSWTALAAGGLAALHGVVEAAGGVLLPFLEGMPGVGIAGIVACAGIAATPGLLRVFRRTRPVRTVALLSSIDEPTPFLTCAAAVGSYTGCLEVVDRTYDEHFAELLGEGRAGRQSGNLTMRTEDGTTVRVVEVARPEELTDAQRDLLLASVDGLVFLETPSEPADDLRLRFTSPERDVPSATLTIDPSARAALPSAAEGPVQLAAVRERFVEACDADADWGAVAGALWSPFDRVLSQLEPALLPAPSNREGEDS